MMSHSFNPVSRPSRPDGRVGASRGVSLEPSRRGGAALELAIGKLFSALARTTVGVMSRAIARRANVAAYLSRCGWDVDRAATASLVAFARSSSTVKPGTDFKVPPPPVTSEAIGTGGRSSFRCVDARRGERRRARRGRARGGRAERRGRGGGVGSERARDRRGLERERAIDDVEPGLTDVDPSWDGSIERAAASRVRCSGRLDFWGDT